MTWSLREAAKHLLESPLANSAEAKAELARVLREQELVPYAEWRRRLIEGPSHQHIDLTASSGQWYQVDVDVYWDDQPEGVIRVAVCIDDAGPSAYRPLCDGFLIERPSVSD
jgi:hypothetical protein